LKKYLETRCWKISEISLGEIDLLVSIVDWYLGKDSKALFEEVENLPLAKKVEKLADFEISQAQRRLVLESMLDFQQKFDERAAGDSFSVETLEFDDDLFCCCKQAFASPFCSPQAAEDMGLDNFFSTLGWRSDTTTEIMGTTVHLFERIHAMVLRSVPVDRQVEIEVDSEEEFEKIKEAFGSANDLLGLNVAGPTEIN